MEIQYYVKHIHPILRDTLNGISLISACTVILLVSLIALRSYQLVDRTTFKIQAGIALADIVRHADLFLMFNTDKSVILCKLIPFVSQIFTHVYINLNVAIALNLHLIVLMNMRPSSKWQRDYWLGSFMLAFLINTIALAIGIFGKGKNICSNSSVYYASVLWQLFLDILPNSIGMLYCLGVAAILMHRLHHSPVKVTSEGSSEHKDASAESAMASGEVRLIICRVGLYPVACFLTLSGFTALLIHNIYYPYWLVTREALNIWSSFSLRSAGLLNLLAFACNPLFIVGIFLFFKPTNYEFNQRYNPDQPNALFSNESNFSEFSGNPAKVHSQKLVQFRSRDRHLGPMSIEEYMKFL